MIKIFSGFERILTPIFKFFHRRARFIIPVTVNAALGILMFSWIQLSINWRPDLFSCKSWMDVFTIWDGGWYNIIAKCWYQDIPTDPPIPVEQVFAFYPGFPAIIRALSLFIGDVLISQVVIATIFGIVWIPLRQMGFPRLIKLRLFPNFLCAEQIGHKEA